MSNETIASFNFASQEIAIYLNIFNLIVGIPGAILNIIVFLSLKTFRDSTCAFYLIIMSLFNIGELICGALSRFLITGYGIDWTVQSVSYCKFRAYFVQVCELISLSCLCLATIDQYFATSSRPRWQQWSNIKLVRYMTVIVIIFWSTFATVYAVYYNIGTSSITSKLSCTNTNSAFSRYNSYFESIIMIGFLPNSIAVIFGILARRNVSQLAYRTVPLVRRELDKQLTTMLLVQVVFNTFSLLFYNISSVIIPLTVDSQNPVVIAKIQLVSILSTSIYYLYAACPFYIYICVSDRFRRQLAYVFFVKYFNYCKKPQIGTNEVGPQP